MKTMIVSDLLILKNYLVQQLITSVVVAAFISVAVGNLYAAMPTVGVMVPISLAFSVLAFDERANWEQFRLTLPLSRADVVHGRYASLIIIGLAGLAIGLVDTGLLAAASMALPNVPMLGELTSDGVSPRALLAAGTCSLVVVLAMFAIVMPLISRFGMTKAVRFVPLVVVFGMVGFLAFGDLSAIPGALANLMEWAMRPANALPSCALATIGALALYLVSAALSARLYTTREL